MKKSTKNALIFSVVMMLLSTLVLAYTWKLQSFTPVQSCNDTDHGLDAETPGLAYGKNLNGVSYSKFDFCHASNNLTEYACFVAIGGDQMNYISARTFCPNGCSNGACNS